MNTNPWLVVLGICGGLFILLIIAGALSDDSDEVARSTPTPTATPDWRTFMDDRDLNLISSGVVRLGLRYDVQLDEYKVKRFFAQNATETLAKESGWDQFWLWIRTVIFDYDEHDVAYELEDAIYDDGGDVRELLEWLERCLAINCDQAGNSSNQEPTKSSRPYPTRTDFLDGDFLQLDPTFQADDRSIENHRIVRDVVRDINTSGVHIVNPAKRSPAPPEPSVPGWW